MKRNSWKNILVPLAILTLAVTGPSRAQQNNSSPDGLYAVPDGESVDAKEDSTSQHAAQDFLNSLDPQGEKFKRDMQQAEASRRAAAAARQMRLLEANGGKDLSPWHFNLSVRSRIVIAGIVGLLASLIAGGYIWWSRAARSKASAGMLLSVNRKTAKPESADKQDKPSTRRAA